METAASNMMYAKTLDVVGIDRSRIRPTRAPFHSIVPRKLAVPLGQIDLPITLGNLTNYRIEKEFDQLATSFITPFGSFCYVTMSFGLKNTGLRISVVCSSVSVTSLGKPLRPT